MNGVMYEQTRKGLIIRLPGEIDHHFTDDIRKEIDHRIENGCVANLIFDFKNTDFMDSSGIGLLLGRYKMVSYLGGTVTAIHVPEPLYRMMRMSGIDKIISINCEAL